MSINSVNSLNTCKKMIKNNQFIEAGRIISAALSKQPNNIKFVKFAKSISNKIPSIDDAESRKLIELFNSGNHKEAISFINEIKADKPLCPILNNFEGIFMMKLNKLDDAILAFKKSLSLKTNFNEAKINLALCLKNQGKYKEAISLLRRVIQNNPKLPQAQNNLGNIYLDLKNYTEAKIHLTHAIRLDPNYVEAFNNLGLAHFHLDQTSIAIENFSKAIDLNAEYGEAYSNIGNVYYKMGEFQTAQTYYLNAAKHRKHNAEVYYNLGVNSIELSKFEDAQNYFKIAIQIDPLHAKAYTNLCSNYEKSNEITKAKEVLLLARTRLTVLPPTLVLLEAQLAFREELYKDVLENVENTNLRNLEDNHLANAYELMGKCYEKIGEYKSAFDSFSKMNLTIKNTSNFSRQNKSKFLMRVQNINNDLRTHGHEARSASIKSAWDKHLIFLIGFPRSGTTLLDSVLRSSKQTLVLEEKPFITQSIKKIGDPHSLTQINNLSTDDLLSANEFYRRKWSQEPTYRPELVLIDKLPLNLVEIPFILRCFPNSRFIMAIRHPMECIFSSWTQNFKLNEAMVNMLDLEDASTLYDQAMSIYAFYKSRYPSLFHEIKYEDLVNHFDETTKNLAAFVGIPWEEDFRNFYVVAQDRDRINTPSYTQVTKPIYKTSLTRSDKFESELSKIVTKINPWKEYFDYN